MRPPSATHADDMQPLRGRPWVAIFVAAALIATYALILVAPAAGTHATRSQLHGAVASLGNAINVVEASYADGEFQISDRHLGLPGSAAFCAHLRLYLPETGRARLTCELRVTSRVHGTLVLHRSPQGAWHCQADVTDPHLLPAACATRTYH